MWVLKIELTGEGSIFDPLAKKYNLTGIAYPINSFKKNGKYYFTGAGTLIGDSEKKELYIKDLKKDKRIRKIEYKKDFFIVLYERDIALTTLYKPDFIMINPIIITNRGSEIWEIGCWEKKPLMKVSKIIKKSRFKIKILKFKEERIDNLALINIIPDLTKKQKRAIELAVHKGYYEYPKKVELKELAKIMGLSYSTFQAHLKKAEGKLIPYMAKNI